MKRYILPLALVAALSPLHQAHATVQFETEKKTSYQDQQAADFEKTAQSILGKSFWFEPQPKVPAFMQLKFKESLPSAEKPAYDNYNSPTFRPTEKVAFTVTNIFVFQDPKTTWRSPEYYAEITFEGGKVGYLEIKYSTSPPFKVYDPKLSSISVDEVVYTEDPDTIRQREYDAKVAEAKKRIAEAKKRIADEKAWEARGGVRLGMTKKQVLDSNWGEPDDVNKTSTGRGTFEQWVYSDDSYLYFTNGRLTTIQN